MQVKVSAAQLTRLKTVIRCRAIEESKRFYVDLLGCKIVEEWTEQQGKGCVVEIAGALLEFYEMTRADPRFREAFREPVANDKIDLQLKTEDVNAWAQKLKGRWEFKGPEKLPWGQTWIRMRDPDGVLVAIYEDRSI